MLQQFASADHLQQQGYAIWRALLAWAFAID
jgi:hypothetical protein